jgi:uncharacterized membrane protein
MRRRAAHLKDRPVLVFSLLALTIGLIFIFSLAPLSGTDEFTHFPRVYQISDGTLWERKLPGDQFGGYLPKNINNMVNDYRNLSRESTGSQYLFDTQKLNKEYGLTRSVGQKKVQSIFTSTVTYPPWAYAPSIIGVLLAKILHLPLIWYVYLGRISSLLAWIILTAVAIKFMPSGKWYLVTVALLPTSLTQAATISSDGLVNGISWLIIAITLAVLAKKVDLRWNLLIAITILMIYLSVIKDSYWLIALFPIIVPIRYFETKWQAIAWKGMGLVSVALAGGWFVFETTKKASDVVLVPTVGVDVNTKAQIHYLLHHLLAFTMRALWQPFTKSFDTIYIGIIGIYTNRLIYSSLLVIVLLIFALYWGLERTKPIPDLINKRLVLCIAAVTIVIGTYLLIAVSFYLADTSVGSAEVNGMYGRYFLPLLPLLAVFPMVSRRKYYEGDTLGISLPIIISVIALTSTIMSIQ